MSCPHAAAWTVQPNAGSTAQPSGNAAPQPRLNPIPIPFAGPYQTLGAPPPAPYPAPFYHTWRPPAFPPVMPSAAFRGPSVYLPPPWSPGVLCPYPGTPSPPFVDPRYFTQHPVRPGPPGSPQSPMYPPGVFSHQRPAVIHESFDTVAAARPPVLPVAPADAPQFNVSVGKIASTVDKDFILSLLQVCGPVKSWKPVTNPIDGIPTAFGFCEFESAESSLRARRLVNKLSVDGQELVLNVNAVTYLQKYGQSTTEEKVNEADNDAMQKIHSTIEERMNSKCPGSPIPTVQVPASPPLPPSGHLGALAGDPGCFPLDDEVVDEHSNVDSRGIALEEREIRRQCEKEDHLGERIAMGLQCWKDREVTAAGKSSLEIDGASTMYAPMECESTVEHESKSQDWEIDGFHKSNDKERHIVFAPGLLSYEQIRNAGEKAGYELQATSKSGDNKTLDANQLLDTVPKEKEELKQLLATVPKTKEELFSHDVNWAIYDEVHVLAQLRREDTRFLSLWAWTFDPNAILKVKWPMLPARGHRRRGRCGLCHRVLLHLDLLEDHSKAHDDDGDPPPPDVEEFTRYPREVDGTTRRADRRGDQPTEVRRSGRRDDDDNRVGRRGRDGPRSKDGWRDRLCRSLSRGARDRQQQDDNGRSWDRSGGSGRWCSDVGLSVVASTAKTLLLSALVTKGGAAPLVLLGSGSNSGSGACELEMLPVRGRSLARQGSPGTVRRRSLESLTPPASLPLSPTPVLPGLPHSRRDVTRNAQSALLSPSPASEGLC
ncbi:putative endo-1,3(4)-beta-glucanase 2 [Hordeum vulgare]|nr:putative endo-1,3(4)-beta-glucanase 2 [Hordeum vulgare]